MEKKLHLQLPKDWDTHHYRPQVYSAAIKRLISTGYLEVENRSKNIKILKYFQIMKICLLQRKYLILKNSGKILKTMKTLYKNCSKNSNLIVKNQDIIFRELNRLKKTQKGSWQFCIKNVNYLKIKFLSKIIIQHLLKIIN